MQDRTSFRGTFTPIEVRFWAKVNKTGPVVRPLLGSCWLWTASTNKKGYGRLGEGSGTVLAHRLSWRLTYGDPGDLAVLHRCDNPPCVRPSHLFLGTILENNDDMLAKGRNPRGEEHGKAILTDDLVREIRSRYVPYKVTKQQLANRYGVALWTIKDVLNRKNWAHVD